MNNNLLISMDNITKYYGKFKALDSLCLHVKKGCIHGLVGPNGAGKSTTLKILAGCIHISSGTGLVCGNRIGSVKARRYIGYVPEFPGFYSDLSAAEYLIYMGRLHGLDRKTAKARARELFKEFELTKYSSWYIKKYSTGMRKKMALMQSLIHRPDILLLDEPTSNLDPLVRGELIDRIKYMAKEQGITFLISSHVLSELEQFIDCVTLIDKGVVQLDGLLSEVISADTSIYLLKTDNDNRTKDILNKLSIHIKDYSPDKGFSIVPTGEETNKRLFALLVEEGISPEGFTRQNATLDEVYRRTVTTNGEGRQ